MIESLQIVPLIVIVLVLTTYIWSGIFIKKGFERALLKANSEREAHDKIKSTVVVAGKNEAKKIEGLFDCLVNQTRAAEEFKFVDDGSTDSSLRVLSELEISQLNVISIPESRGKKNALRSALADLEDGRVLMTDADCKPSRKWVETHRGSEREIIVGYAPLKSSGLVGEIVEHETFLTATMAASAIGHNRPYMATGRNWSFPISLYHEVGAYDGIDEGISGDDDLLLQKMADQPDVTTTFVFDPDSWVVSDGPSNLKEWLRQKRRHSSAGRHYPMKFKAALASYQLFNILLWLLPLMNFAIGLVVGLILKYFFTHIAARLYFQYDISFLRFVWRDFLYFLYNFMVVPIGLLAPPKKW